MRPVRVKQPKAKRQESREPADTWLRRLAALKESDPGSYERDTPEHVKRAVERFELVTKR